MKLVVIILASLMPSFAHSERTIRPDANSAFESEALSVRLADDLRALGLSQGLLALATAPVDPVIREQVILLNLGAISQPSDRKETLKYVFPKDDIHKNRQFLSKHATTMRRAAERFGVSPEYITALLWTETRHGKVIGNYPVVDVFSSLLVAVDPDVSARLVHLYKKRYPDLSLSEIRSWLNGRIAKKTRWAESELIALDKMYKRSPGQVKGLKGSYAGAFGISQFLPSSYLRWAVSAKAGRLPNLFLPEDAIFSAANYLKKHGWRATALKSRSKALFAYNRSDSYVTGILGLASELRTKPSVRQMASSKQKRRFQIIPEAEAHE